MMRIAFWAALATGAALAAGCGEGKQLPDDIPNREPPKVVEPAVPKASEPAAKEYLAKAVRALTGGKPELVQRAKVSRAAFKGRTQLPGATGLVQFDAARKFVAVWPDRAHVTDDLTFEKQTERVEVFLHRPRVTVRRGGAEFKLAAPEESARVFASDAAAQFWVALGLPLVDPGAVAYDLRPASASAPVRVRLALPDVSALELAFDAKTDRLARVEYTTTEQGRTRRKEWALTATQPDAQGVHLPHKFEYRQDGVLVEEWTAEKWEFPASIPDAEFVPPPAAK